ncbi:hypothetical protein [Nocardioides lijunqiniae]|uniref:hypothetical protein n=1 Tax=Nocardioides lijunqiniae TaxID=2760832 RepID=UPI0018779C5B|nr:hypothetical protein [Nocardioides lijunqiniae]
MRVLAGWLLVAAVLTGCGAGGDGVEDGGADRGVDGGADGGAALERQREDVRSAAAQLVTGAIGVLGGRSSHTGGGFDGCESAGPDEFRTFRYRASGRVDVGPGAVRPYLDALAPVLTSAGFDEPVARERPGGRSLQAERDGVSASFSELPGAGDYVLVNLQGPCVEVPEDERDAWLRRQDPTPYL